MRIRALLPLLALCAAPALFGHGGGHNPPPPPGPPPTPTPQPGPGGPSIPNPGPGGSPAAPNPGNPSTGGGPPPRRPNPGPGGQNPGPGVPQVTTPGGAAEPDLAGWQVWWEVNHRSYLELKAAIWDPGTETGSDEFFLGHGQKAVVGNLRPSPADLAREALPALLAVIASERQPEVLSGCLMALAKMGPLSADGEDGVDAQAVQAVIERFLDSPNQQIAETAALALGVHGLPSALPRLAALLSGNTDAARRTASTRHSERTRAFAAYGLGIAAARSDMPDARRYAVQRLTRELESGDASAADIGVACAYALALLELPSSAAHAEPPETPLPAVASREALVRWTLARLDDRRLRNDVRAHLARTAAALVDPDSGRATLDDALRNEVVTALLVMLERARRSDPELRHGVILALGGVVHAGATRPDAAARDELLTLARDGDGISRGLALMSLAQIGGRPGPGELGALEGTADIHAFLLERLARGRSREQPFAALALGVQGHHLLARGLPLADSTGAALRMSLDEQRSPLDVGAYALALGLRRDGAAAPLLAKKLGDFADAEARGYLALALGMIGDHAYVGLLQRELPGEIYRPESVGRMAMGLALLGDKALVPDLVERMRTTPSSSVRAIHAWTLGFVGDARAIAPILALLADDDQPILLRGIAALALGFAAEPTDRPWNTALARNAHYPNAPPTLTGARSGVGGGALDIR